MKVKYFSTFIMYENVISSEALNLCTFFVIENNFIKLSQIVLHVWETCLLLLMILNWVIKWRRIRWTRKCLLWSSFPLPAVPTLYGEIIPWRVFCSYCTIERHHRQDRWTIWRNWKCVCDKRAKGHKPYSCVPREEFIDAARKPVIGIQE
jgi:hypothetical protein